MSGEEIRFTRNGKEVKFELGEKVDNDLKKKDKKLFKNLFEAIANSDGNKELSADEMKMVKDLQTIFAKTGEDRKSNGAQVLDADDMKLAEEFKSSNMGIKDFIAKKLKEVTTAKPVEEVVETPETPAANSVENETVEDKTVKKGEKQVEQNDSKAQTVVKKEVTQTDKNKQFNAAMQNLAEKKFGAQKDELTQKFTKEVEVNKPLYTIAKEALRVELGKEPSMKEINDRIAQIALVNGIKDVNNIPRGKKIKVGTGTTAPAQGQETPVQGQGEAPTKGRETGRVPVEKPAGGLGVKPDKDLKDWTEKTDATLPEGVDLNNGTLKTYTQGTNEATKTKYVYEKDGIAVEANTVVELKGKIEIIKAATALLANTPENETAEAKQTRFQGAIDALIGLGTESAVKKAQEKLAENKANVAADYYAEKTAAMIKSGNPALIEQMLGTDGAKFAEVVNNSPVVQEAIGAVLKSLVDKFNNDEYLTLDEQRIKAVLDKCVDKTGVTVEAKPAQAAQAATETTPAKEATPEVVAKTLVTDKEGNSYYKAALTENGAFKDVEFRAKDSEQLNEFMIKLKAATTDDAKKALFKEFAEKPNVDSELLKSMVKEASKFKAGADVVLKLVENANLDLIYAMDTSHFADVEANKDTGVAASQDKTNVQNAIKARIEAIMADETLRALPENAKYLDKIKGIQIPAESTAITKVSDVVGWTREEVEVPTGEKDANGNDIKVAVTKYSKEGQADVYRVEVVNPMSGTVDFDVEADSAEAVVELKKQIEALALDIPGEGATLDAEQKRGNLEKLAKLAEIRPTEMMFKAIADTLKSDTLIDKNDPDAKALVQKLLLTRDAKVVKALVKYSHGIISNQLFENDPVALKTLAAMFKEIRDLENQGVKLTPEQIALKDVLVSISSEISSGSTTFTGSELYQYDGTYWAENPQLGRDFKTAWDAAGVDVAQRQAVIEKFLNDPRVKEDLAFKAFLAKSSENNIVCPFDNATVAQQKAIIDLIKDDARALAQVDLSKVVTGTTDEEKAAAKEVKDAYVAAALNLFKFEAADGAKLDPAIARYLTEILTQIDSINSATRTDGVLTDADDAVIAEILGNFFTGEGADTRLKDFRRFTYEEMEDLADAVANYGTAEQNTALANMITPEEMEKGQFVRAIEDQYDEGSFIDNAIKNKYAEFMDQLTTPEETLAFLKKMLYPGEHLPNADKIMEKFGDNAEIQKYLIKYFSADWTMSDENKVKLLKTCMQVDANGNYSFDKTKLPEGVRVDNVIYMMPHDCTKGEAAKMFKAVLMTLDLSDERDNILTLVQSTHTLDEEMKEHLLSFIDSDAVKKGTSVGNRYIDYITPYGTGILSDPEGLERLYQNATNAKKGDMIRHRNVSDSHVCVQSGDSIDKIVKNYLKNNLDKFPLLKESVDNDTDRSKWTDARIEEALEDYMKDFRTDILNDLGITDPTKLREGDIIELDKIKWDEHQPNWLNYKLFY